MLVWIVVLIPASLAWAKDAPQAVSRTVYEVAPGVQREVIVGQAGKGPFVANVLVVDPDWAEIRVGLAGGRVGSREVLSAIATRYGALAAVNGGYFRLAGAEAYPVGNLICGGELTAAEDVWRTSVGFGDTGELISGYFSPGLLWGENTSISGEVEEYWKGVAELVTGGPLLVEGGRAVFQDQAEGFTGSLSAANPRTAVGRRGDGKVLLVTVDGRQPGISVGLTLEELSLFMVSLGAEVGVALDGGGSTEMWVKGEVVNRPSDGRERPLSNAILVLPRQGGRPVRERDGELPGEAKGVSGSPGHEPYIGPVGLDRGHLLEPRIQEGGPIGGFVHRSPFSHPAYVTVAEEGYAVSFPGYASPGVTLVNRQGDSIWTYGPVAANSIEVLPGGNFLLAESGAPGYPFVPRVVEVNPRGEVVWKYEFSSRADAPYYAARLPSGHTLVVLRDKVLEVDRGKNIVWSYGGDLSYAVFASRLSKGTTLIVDRGVSAGRVLEVDRKGRVVWEFGGLVRPVSAVRLADGTTVIADAGQQCLVLVSPSGKFLEKRFWLPPAGKGWTEVWFARPLSADRVVLAARTAKGDMVLEVTASPIRIFLGETLLVTDTPAVLTAGRTFVPLRGVMEALGAEVAWDQRTYTASVKKGEVVVQIRPGDKTARVRTQIVELDAPAFIRQGRTMIPLRFVAEAMGVEVVWDGKSKAVYLNP